VLRNIFGYRRTMPVGTIQPKVKVKEIRAKELFQEIQTGNAPLLVDVRSPEEYKLDGHIENSRLLPLQMLFQRMNELPKDKSIVCICRSGNRSQVACEQLASQGFSDVTNLVGGMIDWHRNGLPSK